MNTTDLAGGPAVSRPRPRRDGRAVTALIVLSLIPLTAGTLRLIQLTGGPELIPAETRFPDVPVALVTHIIASAMFALVGAFQFVPRLRRKGRSWHRRAGRVVLVAGLAVGVTALWMTLFYPRKDGTGDLLWSFRLIVGTATLVSLALAFAAIRKRDIPNHRVWMMRAYALGLGAGTQIFTEGFSEALFGNGVIRDDLAKGLAWIINIAVAEVMIRRGGRPRSSTARAETKTRP